VDLQFWDEHVSEKDGTKVNDRWNARCCRATLSLSHGWWHMVIN
jgi:hypothetical protein